MKKIFALLLVAAMAVAGSIDPDLAVIMAGSTDTDLIPVFILAHGQVDRDWVNSATMGMDRNERQQFAVSAMKNISEVSQQNIILELELLNSDNQTVIQPLWLSNAIYCELTPSAIRRMASRSDVLFIEGAAHPDAGLSEPVDVHESTPEELEKGLAWGVSKINADDAWALGYEGQGIIVGVIDTGVDYNHTDLAANMWSDTQGYHGYDFYSNDHYPMDDYGHGTHCAGSVAGNGAAGTQTGVAPLAQIMALRINYYSGGEYTWIQAMEYGVENGASVLTMSLGSGQGNTTLRTAEENLLTAGVFHAVCAHNDGPSAETIRSSADSPPPWFHPDQIYHGGLSAVVSVGATNNSDVIASFSSRGPVTCWTDYNDSTPLIAPSISGPGVNVVSTQWTGGYTTMSGTSMATPHVAGVAALLLSANQYLTVAQLDSIMEMTSIDLGDSGKDNSYGAGRVDAYQAVLAAIEVGTEQAQGAVVPASMGISAISPNPVSNFASFSVYSAVSGTADISVFDVSGRRVANIDNSDIESGANAYNWQIPSEMGSGVYFVRATINGSTVSSRMTVVR